MNSGELRWTKTERQKDRNTKGQYTGLIKLPHEFQWSNMNYDKRLIIILDCKIVFLVSKKPLSCLSNLMNLTKISKVVFSRHHDRFWVKCKNWTIFLWEIWLNLGEIFPLNNWFPILPSGTSWKIWIFFFWN